MLLENITLGQLLRRTAEQHPDRPALEYRGTVFSYGQMDDLVDRFSLALLNHGVQPGDHIAILCEAEPNTIFLSYAITRIGGVVVMLNTSLLRPELVSRLNKADIRYLLIGDGYKDIEYPTMCRDLSREVPVLKDILYIGQQTCDAFPSLLPAGEEADLALVYEAASLVQPEDTAYILFTSGTGSSPKAVLSSHYSRTNSGILQARDLDASCHDRFCVAMPVFHCFSLSVNVYAACAAGACLYLPESRRTEALLNAVSEGKCTVFSCVPALFRALLRKPNLEERDLRSLRTGFIGGSSYPDALFLETEERLGFTLLSSLGQTEATAGITTTHVTDPLSVRLNTVGHFMEHVEGRIVDPATNVPVETGVAGEICVRGYVVMQGYYNQPEETAKAIDADGWLHTGDMGWLDEDGNVHLCGRLKELIIRGGENISPKEIETVFFDDPRVLQCRAVGVPDEHYGEEICLCVVTDPEDPYTEEEIRQTLTGRLAAYKIPRYILFLEQLPVTSTGKVMLQALKDLAVQLLNLK